MNSNYQFKAFCMGPDKNQPIGSMDGSSMTQNSVHINRGRSNQW